MAAVSLVLYMADDIYESRYAAAPDGSPSIRIDRIEANRHNAEQFAFARELAYELVGQLTTRNQFRVYAPEISTAFPSDSQSASPDYVLSGFVQSDGRIMVQLMDWQSGRIIWVSDLEAEMSAANGFDFQVKASVDAILRQIAGRPGGA